MSANRNTKRPANQTLSPDVVAGVEPRTELGKKLAAIRTEIINSGEKMLDDDELEREIAERRGGYYRGSKDE